MSVVYNVVMAFVVVLQLPLQTKLKLAGHLGLTSVRCAQLIGRTAGVMKTCSVLHRKQQTGDSHTHAHQTASANSDNKEERILEKDGPGMTIFLHFVEYHLSSGKSCQQSCGF